MRSAWNSWKPVQRRCSALSGMASLSQVSVKHRAAEFKKILVSAGEEKKFVHFVRKRSEIRKMNTGECSAEAALAEFNQRAGALPAFASDRAFEQHRCPSDENVQ
ncbi:hypothetical protein PO909_002496 [Leuciscus waleckii]